MVLRRIIVRYRPGLSVLRTTLIAKCRLWNRLSCAESSVLKNYHAGGNESPLCVATRPAIRRRVGWRAGELASACDPSIGQSTGLADLFALYPSLSFELASVLRQVKLGAHFAVL